MYSDTRTAYGRIILHNEPLVLDDTIAGYDSRGEERTLLTAKELLHLPVRKQSIGYITSILMSRAAHYAALERQSEDRPPTVIGGELTGEKTIVMLRNGYLLESRRAPGLVLHAPAGDASGSPRSMLRLDSLLEYEDAGRQFLAVKSGTMEPVRAHNIVLGMLHLRRLFDEGRYGLLFYSPRESEANLRALRADLRGYRIPVFGELLHETMREFTNAATDVLERLPDLQDMTFEGKELQPLRLISGE